MDLSPIHVSFVVACSALVAACIAPMVNLVVSRRQFNASVLSANREKWIGKLRETTSELLSRMAVVSVHKQRWKGEWDEGRALLQSDDKTWATFQRIVQLHWELRLLTNPNDERHTALCQAVSEAVGNLQSNDGEARWGPRDADRIAAAAQAVLKAEWRRVKLGS